MCKAAKHLIISYLLVCTINPLYSQPPVNSVSHERCYQDDSLQTLLFTAESKIERLKKLISWGNYDSALAWADRSLQFFDSLKLTDFAFRATIQKAAIYRDWGDYLTTHEMLNKLMQQYADNPRYQITTLNNLGIMYRHKGDYPAALDAYYEALSIVQKHNIKTEQANIYNNIGVIHVYLQNYDKALKFYNLALEIHTTNSDTAGIGTAKINIGQTYRLTKNYEKAAKSYQEALQFVKYRDYHDGLGMIYNELASITIEQNKLEIAPQYLQKALQIFTDHKNKRRIAECKINFGNYYAAKHQYTKAVECYLQAQELAQDKHLLELQSDATLKISTTYEKMGKASSALTYYKKHIDIRDSIFNHANTRKSIEAEFLYKINQQQEAMRIEQAKNEAIYKEKSDKQRLQRNFLIVVIVLMLMIVGGTFVSLRRNMKDMQKIRSHQEQIEIQNNTLQQKQEEIIAQRDEIERNNEFLEESKKIIQDKNRRLTSSIEYAQTIQKSLLPMEFTLKQYFSDHFVINLPKDIVSGDFYWVNRQNNYIDIAVMDCTGHGVPGAFMSLIGNTLLNQIVKEWQIHNPAVILDNFDESLRTLFSNSENKILTYSTIDVALLVINQATKQATFSSANRPLLYSQFNKLEEVHSTPRSVGSMRPVRGTYFKNTEITLTPDTCFYLTTDGYSDQMNVEQKKFGKRTLVQLLSEIQCQPLAKQREILLDTFERHKGHEEQLDDVCMIGLKP